MIGRDGSGGGLETSVPAELLMRRDRTIRYERGSAVYATDGRIGVLRQVVVDPSQAEVVALVVELEGTDRRVFFSPDLVDKTGGSAVFLTVNHQTCRALADQAPEYHREHLTKVDPRALRRGQDRGLVQPRRSVAQAGRDYIETPMVLDSRLAGARGGPAPHGVVSLTGTGAPAIPIPAVVPEPALAAGAD